jgi:hypothetical protein
MTKKLLVASSMLMALAVPALASVVVTSPASGTEVGSTFSLSASADKCSDEQVVTIGYSFDSSADTTVVDGTSLDTTIGSSAGEHTLHVKAWGENGAVCVEDIKISVKATPSDSVDIPPDAVSNSNLQTLHNWGAAGDKGAVGHSSGSTRIVSSPSLHGATREFVTNYKSSGDERYWVRFSDNDTATHFFYDTWVYLTASTGNIANMEFDMNQVMPNGWTVTFGIQCDGYSNTWDYTTNLGSAKKWHDHWLHSGSKCDLQSWKKNAWHHVQAAYFRNDAGHVTYQSVWLDGKEFPINRTTFSGFELGWSKQLTTNFQVDGRGKGGENTVYMDSLTVSHW